MKRFSVYPGRDQFEEIYWSVYDHQRCIFLGFKGNKAQCYAEAARLNGETITPFNQGIHDNLLHMGFTHKQYEEDWKDAGDVETGPLISGGPAFDEYLSESTMTKVIVSVDGSVEYFGDADFYDFFEYPE